MEKIFGRPESLTDFPYPYCPGCGHGIVQRLVGEAMDQLGIVGKAIGVTSAGCSVRNWKQFACDMTMGLHGRGPAVATGSEAHRPGVHHLYLPGRRGHGGDRDRGDRSRRGPLRAHHGHLREQCRLRGHGRTAGPHHPSGPENDQLSRRARSPDRADIP